MTDAVQRQVTYVRSLPVQLDLQFPLPSCSLSSIAFPSLAMDQHLSLSESRAFTGKSESTLKRLLRDIVSDPSHPDRSFILPSPEEIERRKAANEPYAWKIDRQLLLRRFPVEDPMDTARGAATETSSSSAPSDVMLLVLQEQLKSKDQQIRTLEVQLDRKDDQISNLNERMRESNVLMRELQQKLALPSPRSESKESVVSSQPSEPAVVPNASVETSPRERAATVAKSPKATPQKKSDAKPTPKAAAKPTKKRRGFFGRLFLGAH